MPAMPIPRYWVQVMATYSEVEAQRAWGQSQADLGRTVTVMKPRIERTETTVGTLFGIQLGPFESHSVAKDLCTWLKERNGDCFVIAR